MNLLISNQNVNKIKMSYIERIKSFKKDIESSKSIKSLYRTLRSFVVFVQKHPDLKKLIKKIEQRELTLRRDEEKQWSRIISKIDKERKPKEKLNELTKPERDFEILEWCDKHRTKLVQKHQEIKNKLEKDILIKAWNQLKEIKSSYASHEKEGDSFIFSDYMREQEEGENKNNLRDDHIIDFRDICNYLLTSLDNKNKNQEFVRGNKIRKKKMGLPIPSIKFENGELIWKTCKKPFKGRSMKYLDKLISDARVHRRGKLVKNGFTTNIKVLMKMAGYIDHNGNYNEAGFRSSLNKTRRKLKEFNKYGIKIEIKNEIIKQGEYILEINYPK